MFRCSGDEITSKSMFYSPEVSTHGQYDSIIDHGSQSRNILTNIAHAHTSAYIVKLQNLWLLSDGIAFPSCCQPHDARLAGRMAKSITDMYNDDS